MDSRLSTAQIFSREEWRAENRRADLRWLDSEVQDGRREQGKVSDGVLQVTDCMLDRI